jgi:hypothetical protein
VDTPPQAHQLNEIIEFLPEILTDGGQNGGQMPIGAAAIYQAAASPAVVSVSLSSTTISQP